MVYDSLTQSPSFGLCPLSNFLETVGFRRWLCFKNVEDVLSSKQEVVSMMPIEVK